MFQIFSHYNEQMIQPQQPPLPPPPQPSTQQQMFMQQHIQQKQQVPNRDEMHLNPIESD